MLTVTVQRQTKLKKRRIFLIKKKNVQKKLDKHFAGHIEQILISIYLVHINIVLVLQSREREMETRNKTPEVRIATSAIVETSRSIDPERDVAKARYLQSCLVIVEETIVDNRREFQQLNLLGLMQIVIIEEK